MVLRSNLPVHAPAGDRVSGWKAIAAHLGKSVRSVQRWERELGLPVHRVKTRRGQVIYAHRSELDAWTSETRVATALTVDASSTPDAGLEEVAPNAVATKSPTRNQTRGTAVLALFACAVASLLVWPRGPVGADSSVQIRVTESRVLATTSNGAPVWTHDFETPVRQIELGLDATNWNPRADLDGDGVDEYLVPMRFEAISAAPVADHLAAFDRSGKRLWSVRFQDSVSCGARSFDGPWQLSAISVSEGNGPKRTWAAFTNHDSWPSVVVEIDPMGNSRLRYVHSGSLSAVSEWEVDGRAVLVVGGLLNGHQRPAVVFVDRTVLSQSPDDGRFGCVVPGAVPPLQMTLFPLPESATVRQPVQGAVTAFSVLRGFFRVEMDAARIFSEMDPGGGVRDLVLTDAYWANHAQLERQNLVDHPAPACPDRVAPWKVDIWRPSAGWHSAFASAGAQ